MAGKRLELTIEEVAELANALRALSYQEPLGRNQAKQWLRLNLWLRENGATRNGNGWWVVPDGEEVSR